MKKLVLLACAAMALSSAAFAAKTEKKAAAKDEVACAVMPSHKVNVKEATGKKMYADYKGNRYFFCCAGCPAEFKKNPDKYVKAEHIATPKDAEKK